MRIHSHKQVPKQQKDITRSLNQPSKLKAHLLLSQQSWTSGLNY